MGDFNYPDIDYMNVDDGLGSGVGLEASELLQSVSEVGLHQHVREYTRYRSGQNPSCLDYIFTDDEYVIDKLCYTTPLGKSDHVCIEFGYLTNYHVQSSSCRKPDYCKADCESIRSELAVIDWDTEFHNMNTTESWHVFH